MSIHPSLRSSEKGKALRTVLKRTERIKHLIDKGKWSDSSKAYGLPKIKMVRLKVVKKEKAAKKPEDEAAATTTTAAPKAKTEKKAPEKKAPAEKGKS